jgi:hypothetical protein
LNEFDLPVAMLLGNDGLQGDGSIAVSPTAVVKDNVNLLH